MKVETVHSKTKQWTDQPEMLFPCCPMHHSLAAESINISLIFVMFVQLKHFLNVFVNLFFVGIKVIYIFQ